MTILRLVVDNIDREIKATPTRPRKGHQSQLSQWKFEDFVTPEKPKRQSRIHQQPVHLGWTDDEPDDTVPAKPRVVKPRRDAETHFSLTDEIDNEYENDADEQENAPRRRMIASYQNRGMSLYHDPIMPDENVPPPTESEKKGPLSTVPNSVSRRKDFDAHWTLTDTTPEKEKVNTENKKPVATHRLKAVQMMEPHWDSYDESPQKKTAPPPASRSIRNSTQRSWSFGSDDE